MSIQQSAGPWIGRTLLYYCEQGRWLYTIFFIVPKIFNTAKWIFEYLFCTANTWIKKCQNEIWLGCQKMSKCLNTNDLKLLISFKNGIKTLIHRILLAITLEWREWKIYWLVQKFFPSLWENKKVYNKGENQSIIETNRSIT